MHPNEHQKGHRLSTKWVLASDQSSVRLWPVQPIKELLFAAGQCAGKGCALFRQLANTGHRPSFLHRPLCCQYDTSVDGWSVAMEVGGGASWLCFNYPLVRCQILTYARLLFSLSLLLLPTIPISRCCVCI